jgi:4-amino-4-deoxy-L-arabinose transferase-like glycosyltransferase
VIRVIREHRRLFVGATLAGLALRLCFVVYFPAITDDSRIYAEFAANWLQHGVYGQTPGGSDAAAVVPTDTRLPGYPAFLAAIFWLFGNGNYKAVMLAQALVDLGSCFLIADLARRVGSDRAAKFAFLLAALCPFLANYTAAALTETLEVFFTALALDLAVAGLSLPFSGRELRAGISDSTRVSSQRWLWIGAGAAIGSCILLRPDGGILLAAVALYLFFVPAVAGLDVRSRLVPVAIVCIVALAPLAPWTIRNFRALHHFQPLAPRYANESDELVPRGFNRWVKTWMADYVSVEEIYWNVPGEKIDASKLPERAFDNERQKAATLDAIAAYNESQDMTPELDGRFEVLAEERIRAHPFRYYVELPVIRVVDMWMRPRTENLPSDPRWWEFNDDVLPSAVAVGFGLLNLLYLGAALWAVIRGSSGIRFAGLLIGFLVLRSLFLLTLENPEPRYTLEGYPAVIVLASLARLKPRPFKAAIGSPVA